MQHRRSKSLLVLPVIAGLLFAACGSDEDEADETSAPTTAAGATPATSAATETSAAGSTPTTGGGEAASLAGVCPDLITLQTDWMPEAEHGFVYQLIGEDYEIDKANAAVEGPLVDSAGNDMGVRFRVQSGGGAQQFQSVTTLMYSNDDILLGYVYTDEAIQNSAEFPTIAIESGFEKNPQMIMWDPETYPDVKEIADLGEENVKIRYFGGAAYMDYFTSTGLLSKDQVDGSYQGDPSLFVADEGKSAQQGWRAWRERSYCWWSTTDRGAGS